MLRDVNVQKEACLARLSDYQAWHPDGDANAPRLYVEHPLNDVGVKWGVSRLP